MSEELPHLIARSLCCEARFVFDLQKALSYQRALATFTRIVDEPASVAGLLQNATAQVARITHIKHVKILRYRPDRGDLLVEAGVGWKAGVANGHVEEVTKQRRARRRHAERTRRVVDVAVERLRHPEHELCHERMVTRATHRTDKFGSVSAATVLYGTMDRKRQRPMTLRP